MAVRCDTGKEWERLTDGDMHVSPTQPAQRCYPNNIVDVEEAVNRARAANKFPSEARACGSHWAFSDAAITAGVEIESNAPVHESDSNQTEERLNHVLMM